MKNLIELVELVDKNKIKKIEVMGNPTNYSGKMRQLYEGIIDGEFKTEDEAKATLYSAKDNDFSFKKLKYRLEQRLINTLFFIDVNKPYFNDTQRAFYICQKSMAAVDILFGRGARKPAIELAEKTLRQSIKHEFTDVSLNLIKKLSRHYGVMEKNHKKFLKYSKMTEQYLEIYNAETLAEQYHAKLGIYSNETAVPDSKAVEEAKEYAFRLEEYTDKVESNRFLAFAYSVILVSYELINDLQGVLRICDEALKKYEQKKSLYQAGIYVFTSRKISCYIQLKNFQNAEKEILKALKIIPEGKINWYITYEKYMRMLFHQKKYQKAFDIFMKVSVDYGFQPVYKNIIELWKIYEAYFNFFTESGKIDFSKSTQQSQKKFRLNKFLNEVPTYSTDKRGFNVPILIIQILFLLQQKKYDPIIDKVEALNAYCYRYLKKDDTFRSNCFIKMLLLLPKCNFHRVAVERKTQTLFNKLKSVPLEVARQSAEIEIVPYEDLWGIVLEMLENRFHKVGE